MRSPALPLTFTLAMLAASTWVFGSVLEDVLGREELALIDEPLGDYVINHRASWLTAVMRCVTELGAAWFVTSLVLVAGLVLGVRTRSLRPLLFLTAAAAGAGLLDHVLKVAVARPRPPVQWILGPVTGFSFPSGHAAVSAVYGALATLVAHAISGWRRKAAVWAAAGAATVAIGASRVYLGAHWSTDVIGGWALAIMWLTLLLTTTRATRVLGRGRRAARPTP